MKLIVASLSAAVLFFSGAAAAQQETYRVSDSMTLEVEAEVTRQVAPLTLTLQTPLLIRNVFTPNGTQTGHRCLSVTNSEVAYVREWDASDEVVANEGGPSACRRPSDGAAFIKVGCLPSSEVNFELTFAPIPVTGVRLLTPTNVPYPSIIARTQLSSGQIRESSTLTDSLIASCSTQGDIDVHVGAAVLVGADALTGDPSLGTITLTASY